MITNAIKLVKFFTEKYGFQTVSVFLYSHCLMDIPKYQPDIRSPLALKSSPVKRMK